MNNVIAPSLGEAIRVSNNKSAYRRMVGAAPGARIDWREAEQEMAGGGMPGRRGGRMPQETGHAPASAPMTGQTFLSQRRSPYARMIQGGQPQAY